MAGSLGSLVVSLTAETAQFRNDMGKAAYTAQKNFQSIKSSAQTLAGALGIYFSASMFVGWIKSSIDAADAMYMMSQKVGVATDTLSKLAYAAKLSDVGTEDLGTSLNKLNKNIAETARGTGEAQEAFQAMGISVKDANGKIKGTDLILLEVAEKFSTYADGANKSALAMALFGKAGANMIPFLNNGKAGIEAMGQELQRLGGVILPDAAKQANEFNDNLDRMKVSFNSVAMVIGNQVIPVLTELSNEYLVAYKNGMSLYELFKEEVKSPWESDGDAVKRLNIELLNLEKAGKGDTQKAKSVQRALQYHHELQTMKDLAAYQNGLDKSNQGGKEITDGKQAPAIAGSGGKAKVDEVTQALLKQAEAIQKLTLSERDLIVEEVIKAKGTDQQIEASKALADTYLRLKKETEDSIKLQTDYKKLYDETASPVQKLADEEARLITLREKLIANGYDVVQVERMIDEARMNAADAMDTKQTKSEIDDLKDSIQQFSNAISTAFEDAIISGGNFSDMLKGLENTILQIGMRILVTKPLERAMEGLFSNFMPGSGGGSSNWITSAFSSIGSFMFGGARAGGGMVYPGQAYLVGERGPELFSPPTAGSITPNGSSAYSTTININVSGVDNGGDMRRSASQVASMAALAVARGRRNL
jgi:hypothetical protein